MHFSCHQMHFPCQRKRFVALLIMIALIALLIQLQSFNSDKLQTESPKKHVLARGNLIRTETSLSPIKTFELEVREDIQTVAADRPRIPHIFHFIFITDLEEKSGIPAIYKANVKSFVQFNPKWTYFFWTASTARELIATKYPTLLSTWDGYKKVINKADALRYVVLHEFGGVYSDLDMQCRKPLDRATMKYACILTPEPFEHSSILYRKPFLLSTGFMMCRPNHPFMKQAIISLPEFAKHRSMLAIAGPIFLTAQFERYNKFRPGDSFRTKIHNDSNSPYFYKGTLQEDHINAVYVANTRYFMSSFDRHAAFFHRCNGTRSWIVSRGCYLLKNRKFSRSPFSYTDHLWRHMYSIRNLTQMVPIDVAIPIGKLKIWRTGN